MSKKGAPAALDYQLVTSVGLGIVCAACVVIALHDAFWGHEVVDPKTGAIAGANPTNTALLLAVAAAILILPRVRRLKFGDLEFESMQQRLGTVEADVDALATKRLDDDRSAEGTVSTASPPSAGPLRSGPLTAVTAPATRGDGSVAAPGTRVLPPLAMEVEKYLQAFGADVDGDLSQLGLSSPPVARPSRSTPAQ